MPDNMGHVSWSPGRSRLMPAPGRHKIEPQPQPAPQPRDAQGRYAPKPKSEHVPHG